MFYSHSAAGFFHPDIHVDLPADVVEITTQEHAALLAGEAAGQRISLDAGGRPVLVAAPPLSAEQLQGRFTAAIQARLDGWAKERNYDGILSACTYATSSVQKFRDEGQLAVDMRDQTWASAYAILAQVLAGDRPMPSSLADIEADLPQLEWPQ